MGIARGTGVTRLLAIGVSTGAFALTAAGTAAATPAWQTPSVSLGQAGSSGSVESVVDGAGRTFAAWSAPDGTLRVSMHAPGPSDWSAPLTPCGTGAEGEATLFAQSTGAMLICTKGSTTYSVLYREGSGWASPHPLAGVKTPLTSVEAPDGSVDLGWLASDAQLASVKPDGTLAAPVVDVAGTRGQPRLARSATGETVVAAAGAGASIVVARRPAGSATWGTPASLGSTSGTDGRSSTVYDVAVDVRGSLTVLYTVTEGPDIRNRSDLQVVSRPAGETWGTPSLLADYGYDGRLLAAPDGGLTAVWVNNYDDGSDYGLSAAVRPAGEPWGAPLPLSTDGTTVGRWEVATNRQGDVALAWQEATSDLNAPAGGISDHFATSQNGFAPESVGPGTPPAVAVGDDGATTVLFGGAYIGRHEEESAVYAVRQEPGASTVSEAMLRVTGGNPDDPSTWPKTPGLISDAAGDLVAYWQDGTSLWASTDDAGGPALAVSVPESATAGAAVTMSATASDAWQATTVTGWQFGDGTTAEGASVQHAYAADGLYTVTITVEDTLGNPTTTTRTIQVGAPVPRGGTTPGGGTGPTPTPTPPPAAPTPTSPTTPGTLPRLRLTLAGSVRRAVLLAHGLRLSLTCSTRCAITVKVRVGHRLLTIGKSRRASFILRLSKSARRALRGQRTLHLTIDVVRAGRRTTITRSLHIKG